MAAVPGVTSALAPSSAPGATPLVIGGVTFSSEEAPETLPIGGVEQKLVVTELIGGGRVVHAMGVQPKPVTWKGYFFAGNVATRIAALRSYAVDGKERLLVWGSERYYCIVRDFVPPYHNANVAEYEITVEITRDGNGSLSAAAPVSVDSQVGALMSDATLSANSIAAGDVNAPKTLPLDLSNVTIQLQQTGPIAQASPSTVSSLLTTVSTALSTAQTYLGGLAQTAPTFVAAQRLVATLTLIQSNVKDGQSQRGISVMGGSLYAIAAQYYGDVTKAFDLASLNGLPAAVLSGKVTTALKLPPISA